MNICVPLKAGSFLSILTTVRFSSSAVLCCFCTYRHVGTIFYERWLQMAMRSWVWVPAGRLKYSFYLECDAVTSGTSLRNVGRRHHMSEDISCSIHCRERLRAHIYWYIALPCVCISRQFKGLDRNLFCLTLVVLARIHCYLILMLKQCRYVKDMKFNYRSYVVFDI